MVISPLMVNRQTFRVKICLYFAMIKDKTAYNNSGMLLAKIICVNPQITCNGRQKKEVLFKRKDVSEQVSDQRYAADGRKGIYNFKKEI